MKNNISKNFRLEIVLYSLLSMFYTILTVSGVLLVLCLIYISFGGGKDLSKNSMNQYDVGSQQVQLANPDVMVGNMINNRGNSSLPPPKASHLDARMIILLTICMIILSVVLFTLYFLKLTKRFGAYITEITEGIDEVAKGNFEYRIQVDNSDEFGMIADSINAMTVEIQRIMERSQHDEERKHELITSVAHDLRTPLTSVIGYLELLRSSKVNQETKEHYLEIVYSKSKRLENLIEDLFSYTKYTYGDVATIQDPVDIVKLLEQLIEEFYPSFEENQLTYSFQKDCTSMISYADGNLLARAFANLIGNAIKYGAEGKRVEAYFMHNENEMTIRIKNYGAIIPKKDLPYIFERFYRVEDSRSQETGGSGLGLAIAKSIVVMHHGKISAKSNLDETVFEIILPIIREPEKKKVNNALEQGEIA